MNFLFCERYPQIGRLIGKVVFRTMVVLHSVAARGFLALREIASAQEFIIALCHARNTK
jgi:hypothetical protein